MLRLWIEDTAAILAMAVFVACVVLLFVGLS